jgi:hypothetical protein
VAVVTAGAAMPAQALLRRPIARAVGGSIDIGILGSQVLEKPGSVALRGAGSCLVACPPRIAGLMRHSKAAATDRTTILVCLERSY